jgi:hypothetical protein
VGKKIFVSYSHKDHEALEQLQRFLQPLERAGLIESWADTRIKPGDDWAEEINKALNEATVAVLFISQDFLASEFIYQQELPCLLARAEADELTVLPVFLSPSLVEELEIPFVDQQGNSRKDKLSRLQGYGTPQKPLSALTGSDRDQVYQQLSKRLIELAGQTEANRPPSRSSPIRNPVTIVPPVTGSRAYELTVHLELNGDMLDVRYYLPGTDVIDSAQRSWSTLAAQLGSISSQLDSATIGQLSATWGALFFDLLFGKETEWEKIMRALFRQPSPQPRPNPIRSPVRLRICTEESGLLGLPWRLTAWKSYLLVDHDWEFSTTQVINPTEDYTTTAPCNVLIVAPRAEVDGVAPDPGHPQALIDVLKKVWPTGREPGYVRVVQTRRELENALRGMRPHLIYVYGHGTVTGDRASLLLDSRSGPEALSLAGLAGLFKDLQPPPAVVYLNLAGLTVGEFLTPGQVLGTTVPLIIWRRLSVWQQDSTSQALAWLRRWLGEGEDPVRALHQVTRQSTTLEAATLAVHSRYRTWKTQTYRGIARREQPHLALDRDHQKALVAKHLTELVRSDSRRVMALVAYAAPGNLLDSLHQQLQHYLDLAVSDLAEIQWQPLQFPVVREQLRDNLRDELRLQLEADDTERDSDLLRRHAPKVVGSGKRGVLWLNWGVFGKGTAHQEPLKPAQLGDWLRFSSEFLGTHCPADLRLVSYAAIELQDSVHLRLAELLQEYRRQPWCRRATFRLSVLPPLGRILEDDLLDFLEDPNNSSCDPGIQAEIAQRLIAKTGGDFEQTVALMQEAEEGSWYDLLARFQREQGAAKLNEEEPLE